MADGLAALVLAAGAGTRLRPLTHLLPKALCPVGNIPLLDHVLERALSTTPTVAVNAHHHADAIAAHVGGRAHLSIERGEALETAGAIGRLRAWIDGRDLLLLNGDTWHAAPLDTFVAGWDRERVRVLTVRDAERADFGGERYVGTALVPWTIARTLPDRRLGLYSAVLAPAEQAGQLETVVTQVPAYDCGTPAEYLAANLAFASADVLAGRGSQVTGSADHCVVGQGATIAGRAERCVLWPETDVAVDEVLRSAIRARDDVTVLVKD